MADVNKDQGLVQVMMSYFMYNGCRFPNIVLKESLEELKTFDVRPDDVWVCTYPKSGTHFAMEMVSLILGDGDPLKINRLTHMSTVAMLLLDRPIDPPSASEGQGAHPQGQPQGQLPQGGSQDQMKMLLPPPFIDVIKKAPSPRLILTHVPLQLLPPDLEKRAKVLYVARNPKDMITSMMNFVEKTLPIPGGFPQLLQDEMNGENMGGWFNHVQGFWKKRNEKNVLFLKYEDMVQDLGGCVKKVSELLEHPLTDDVFEKVVAGSEFKGMKKTYDNIEKSMEKGIMFTRAGGQMPFMQKGKIGTWKTRFTVAQSEMFDEWYKEKFAGLDLQFQFE